MLYRIYPLSKGGKMGMKLVARKIIPPATVQEAEEAEDLLKTSCPSLWMIQIVQ